MQGWIQKYAHIRIYNWTNKYIAGETNWEAIKK